MGLVRIFNPRTASEAAVVVAAMADPAVRVVSISVSERGYHRRAADGALDEEHPLIRQDLRQPNPPRTVLGLIIAALRAYGKPS